MTIEELRAARDKALADAKAIVAKAEAEERDLNDDEAADVERLTGEAAAHKQAIKDAEAKAARTASLAKALDDEAAWEHQTASRVTRPVNPSNDGVSKPRTVGGEGSGEFAHFGEYLFKVREAAVSPSLTDKRLTAPMAAAPGMRGDVDSLGGFLVPDQFSTSIMERMYSTGQLLSRIKEAGMYFPLQRNSIKIPRVDESSRATGSRSGGVRGYWVGETDSITDSKPAVGQMTLSLHKAGALGYITDEMLEDAPASGAFLERLLTQELIFTVEDSIVNGNGSNKPLGLLNANCAVSVTKETNQTAATIWGPNVTKMWAQLWAPSRSTAVWLVNQSCEPYLFSLALEGRYGSASTAVDAIPLYFPAGSVLNQGEFANLMGRPVLPVEYTKAVGTVGDIILWDPAQYVLVDKAGGPNLASSIHVQFLTDQTTYRVTYRVDGQPTWASSLTPYDAGNALSTIVTLAAR